jgi:hypothetical protein
VAVGELETIVYDDNFRPSPPERNPFPDPVALAPQEEIGVKNQPQQGKILVFFP